ncbi:MAG: allophanate hydrolase [Bryobacteraceae bacterium]|nr:allophanate hydrolase [Bryobacteraceae bacterium]
MKRTNPVWISEIDPQLAKDGPLHGLTFAIKDNIDYAGVPTTCACPESAYTPEKHAKVVERLLDAGAVAVGKTNMDQFATGLVGTRTPYGACSSVFNPEYISGGSSSGSAVAVASGQVDFALGTDTAGSGRVPAAFNGIYGWKPSFGKLSTDGVVPACKTLDCVSVFARTVYLLRRVHENFDLFSRMSFRRDFRFGYVDFTGDPVNEPLYRAAIARLEAVGGKPHNLNYEPFRQAAELLYSGPWVAERYAAVGQWLDHMHPVVKRIIGGATKYSAVDAFNACYRLDEIRRETRDTWMGIDVLLLPTAGWIYKIAEVEATPVELNTNLGYYTNFVNLLDLCALAIPAGVRPDGLPFGVSLVAPRGNDAQLLELAERLETVEVAVVGAHLTGQPLNRQLTDRGARLVKTTRTSRDYRLFALANTAPPKPGLVRESGFEGPGIEVEVWSMPASEFGSFVALIPPPLGIGTVVLADGTTAKGFICEPAGLTSATEITSHGGWRSYLASKA